MENLKSNSYHFSNPLSKEDGKYDIEALKKESAFPTEDKQASPFIPSEGRLGSLDSSPKWRIPLQNGANVKDF